MAAGTSPNIRPSRPMSVMTNCGDGAREADGFAERELPLAREAGAERLTGDEGHDVEELAGGLAAVEERQEVRVLQRGGDADLGGKARRADGGAKLGLEELDGDLPAVAEVLGQIDRRHPSLAQRPDQPVPVGQRRHHSRREGGSRC